MPDPLPVQRRPRVLFVDDQRAVARTLAELLAPLGAECRFADDGESALRRLRSEVFDLVIVDLRMPPTEWGGLWLLEELAARDITVTAVVLSGEGGQLETIKALRLGAFDFVVKDEAGTELAGRIGAALAEATQRRWHAAATELPAAISLPMSRLTMQTDELHALRAGLTCVESIFRFSAVAAACLAGTEGRQLLIDSLTRPSMGTWQTLHQRLRSSVPSTMFGYWLSSLGGDTDQELIRIRNDLHHGAEPTSAWTRDRLPVVGDWLDRFAALARQLPRVQTAVPGSFQVRSSRMLVELADLAGTATTVRWREQYVDAPLETGHVHLLLADAAPVDLWPLMLAEPGGASGQWSVSIVDSRRSGRARAPEDSDTLSYINLSRGERRPTTITVEDVRRPG